MTTTDVVVIGLGGIGSAVLAELARRGVDAIGIDRFDPPHTLGSTHGRTRIIRTAYFEHPDYVPLLRASFDGWATLEAETGRDLYREVGLLEVGPADGTVVPGVLAAADEHDLAVDRFTTGELRAEFPDFDFADGQVGVFEQRAGFLRVEDCVTAALDVARRGGATIRTGETVGSIRPSPAGWDVVTDRGSVSAGSMVVTAGPWAGRGLAGAFPTAAAHLTPRRKSLFWVRHAPPRRPLPCFFFELDDGMFYGFPPDEAGLKVAEHTGGHDLADPDEVDRSIDPVEHTRISDFLADHVPGATGEVVAHEACLYTMTPDEHFIVDRLPGGPGAVVAGLSGHGFKFAPVLGRAMADLAVDGRTDLPIGFLSTARFGD
jgi:sarcosine oxidase